MNTIKTALLATGFLMAIAGSANAQYFDYNSGGVDPMQAMAQMQDDLTREMQQGQQQMQYYEQQSQLIAQEAQRRDAIVQAQVVQAYRRARNDYTSSDAECYQRSMDEFYRQNPGELQKLRNIQHQMNMDNINTAGNISRINADASNYVNELGMQTHNNRMNSMDRIQDMQINSIHERGNYVNPQTGNSVNLGWQPNQFQTDGQNDYYTDGNSRQYQNDGGLWTELDEDR